MASVRGVVTQIRRAGSIRDDAVTAQLAMLRAAKRDVMRTIGDAVGYRRFHLGEVLRGIDQAIAQYKSQMQAPVVQSILRTTDAAADMARAAGLPQSLYGISPQLTQALIDVTTDQVRAVWSELGTGLKVAVRRATLGIDDPFQAIQRLVTVFDARDQWRSTEYDAERIIRTELGRGFEMAGQSEMRQAKAAGVDVRKWWLAINDARAREEHLKAWHRYRPGGSQGPIPEEAYYEVGSVKLRFPGDPQGKGADKELAGATINCRCSSVPHIGAMTEGMIREAEDLLREAA